MGKKKVKKEGEKFTRTYIACDYCRDKHNKCDGQRPLCCHCKRTGQTECTYRRHRPLGQTNNKQTKKKEKKKAESEFILRLDMPTTEDDACAESDTACKREKTDTAEKRAEPKQNKELQDRVEANCPDAPVFFSELSAFFGSTFTDNKQLEPKDTITSYTITNNYVVSPNSPDTSTTITSPHASPPTPVGYTNATPIVSYDYQPQTPVPQQQQMYAAPVFETAPCYQQPMQQPTFVVHEQPVQYQPVPQQSVPCYQPIQQQMPVVQQPVQQMQPVQIQQAPWPQPQRKRHKSRAYAHAPTYVQVYNSAVPDPYYYQYSPPSYFPPQQMYAPQYPYSNQSQGYFMPQNGYTGQSTTYYPPSNYYGGSYSESTYVSSKKKEEPCDFVGEDDDGPAIPFAAYEQTFQ
jgi:hypothetical protein